MATVSITSLGLGNADLTAIGKLSETGLSQIEVADAVVEGDKLKKGNKIVSYDGHLANTSNPHNTTANQVGAYSKTEVDNLLANIDIGGASLTNYYDKTQTETLLSNKVDKVVGKGLSTNDFTDIFKQALELKKVKDISTDSLTKKLVVNYTDGTFVDLNLDDIITDVRVEGAILDATTNTLTIVSSEGGADVVIDLSLFVTNQTLNNALLGKADKIHSHTTSDITGLDTTLSNKVTKNEAIVGATKTKITYDSKGLVVNGTDLSASDIPNLPQSKIINLETNISNKIDKGVGVVGATKTKITYNNDGIITGGADLVEADLPSISQAKVTNLVSDLGNKQARLISGTNIKTINGQSILGNGDIVITGGGSGIGSGNETISGIKTFSSSPIVPTPTTDYQVATKKYVDENSNNFNINGLTNKPTPIYTDNLVIQEVEGSLKKISWSNLKNNLDLTGEPTAPTPEEGDASNKIATTAFIANALISENTYQGAYGFSWDYATDTYIRTGAKGITSIQSMMKRCVLKAEGTVNYYLNPNNSNFKEDGTIAILNGDDGNVMVEIPKTYVKIEKSGTVTNISIALTPEVGYVLHPAFIKGNVEVDKRYYRAYKGYVNNGKLMSVSGVTPTRNQTMSTFRTQAMANGNGWHLTDYNLLNLIKILCFVEFANFKVNNFIGRGNDTGSDYGITTGQSNILGNFSSPATNNDMFMSYRGIENLYGDAWEFIDGVNVQNYQLYVNNNPTTFANDIFTGDYVAKGIPYIAGASASYIKDCSISPEAGFIPIVVGGSSTTYFADGVWSATGNRIYMHGGSAYNGATAGLSAVSVAFGSTLTGADFGSSISR